MSKPKILLWDIETSANVSYTWGKYDQNVIEFQKEWEILSYAFKWLGDKKTSCLTRADFRDKTDKSLVTALWKQLNQADILIGHNADRFDRKKANARFISFGLLPPTPAQTVDTLKVSRANFAFNSNKLDDLGKALGVGRKLQHAGFKLRLGCMSGDKKSFAEMKKYNIQDVELLERVYLKMLPWISKHPNVAQLAKKPDGCPKCGANKFKSNGLRYTKTGAFRRLVCLNCGGYSQSRIAEKMEKPQVG